MGRELTLWKERCEILPSSSLSVKQSTEAIDNSNGAPDADEAMNQSTDTELQSSNIKEIGKHESEESTRGTTESLAQPPLPGERFDPLLDDALAVECQDFDHKEEEKTDGQTEEIEEENIQENSNGSIDDIQQKKTDEEVIPPRPNATPMSIASIPKVIEADRARIESYVHSAVAKANPGGSLPAGYVVDWSLFNSMISQDHIDDSSAKNVSDSDGNTRAGWKLPSDVTQMFGTCFGCSRGTTTPTNAEQQQNDERNESKSLLLNTNASVIPRARTHRSEEMIVRPHTSEQQPSDGPANIGVPSIPNIVKFNDGIPTTYDPLFFTMPPWALATDKVTVNMKTNEPNVFTSPVSPDHESTKSVKSSPATPTVVSSFETRNDKCLPLLKPLPQKQANTIAMTSSSSSQNTPGASAERIEALHDQAPQNLIQLRTKFKLTRRRDPTQKLCYESDNSKLKNVTSKAGKCATDSHEFQEETEAGKEICGKKEEEQSKFKMPSVNPVEICRKLTQRSAEALWVRNID